MAGTFLNYPFDEELFYMQWQTEPDPTKLAMINSGAVAENAAIRQLISNGSNFYTFPIYNLIGGTPDNYDGTSNITMDEPDGKYQSGVVYGRAHSWKARDFVFDFNSGADPMRQISSQVARYWQKQRQKIILGILDGVFGATAAFDSTDTATPAAWTNHTTNIAATTATVTADNKLGETTLGDAIQKAVGDNMDIFSMVWMHSRVAANLANLELLQYRKYTDAQGIQRTLKIADYNGHTVIIDDDVPVADSTKATGQKEYTSYVLGRGALQHASAPVKVPVEIGRDMLTAGGYDYLVTRFRESFHPNGFSFQLPTSCISPTDAQLKASANWKIITDPKCIPLVRIISNG